MATMGIVTIQCQGESCLNFRSNSRACDDAHVTEKNMFGELVGGTVTSSPHECAVSLSAESVTHVLRDVPPTHLCLVYSGEDLGITAEGKGLGD